MIKKLNITKCAALFLSGLLTGLLTACGGGDAGDLITPPVVSLQSAGWWSGVTNTSVPISTLIVGNGAYYHFYASQGSVLISGVILGNGTESAGVFSSTNGLDINFAGNGVVSAQLTSDFVAKTSLNTTVTYPAGTQFTFNSAYNPSFNSTPALATIHGNYLGDVAVVNNLNVSTTKAVSLVIDSNGVATISNVNGLVSCAANGNIVPHSTGNVYDLTMNFNGNSCPGNIGALSGNVFFDPITNRLYLAAMDSGRRSGVIFVGNLQ